MLYQCVEPDGRSRRADRRGAQERAVDGRARGTTGHGTVSGDATGGTYTLRQRFAAHAVVAVSAQVKAPTGQLTLLVSNVTILALPRGRVYARPARATSARRGQRHAGDKVSFLVAPAATGSRERDQELPTTHSPVIIPRSIRRRRCSPTDISRPERGAATARRLGSHHGVGYRHVHDRSCAYQGVKIGIAAPTPRDRRGVHTTAFRRRRADRRVGHRRHRLDLGRDREVGRAEPRRAYARLTVERPVLRAGAVAVQIWDLGCPVSSTRSGRRGTCWTRL